MSLSAVVVLVVLFLVAAYAVILYNGLVRLKHGVGKAWANIDVLLRQRHEELPKLVETCRQYMQHERNMLEQVISARNAVSSAREQGDVSALGQAETGLRAGLGRLFALAGVGLLGAALVTAPWLTLLAVCAIYAATLPFGLASYARVRRRG